MISIDDDLVGSLLILHMIGEFDVECYGFPSLSDQLDIFFGPRWLRIQQDRIPNILPLIIEERNRSRILPTQEGCDGEHIVILLTGLDGECSQSTRIDDICLDSIHDGSRECIEERYFFTRCSSSLTFEGDMAFS